MLVLEVYISGSVWYLYFDTADSSEFGLVALCCFVLELWPAKVQKLRSDICMCCRTLFSLKQLSHRFCSFGKLHDPSVPGPLLVTMGELTVNFTKCQPKCLSLYFVLFRCSHSQLLSSTAIWISLSIMNSIYMLHNS